MLSKRKVISKSVHGLTILSSNVNVSLVTASGTFVLLGANTSVLSSSLHVTAVCGWSPKNNSTPQEQMSTGYTCI